MENKTLNEMSNSDVSVYTVNLPENINWGMNQETLDYVYQIKSELNQLSQSMVEKTILIGGAFYQVQQKCKCLLRNT